MGNRTDEGLSLPDAKAALGQHVLGGEYLTSGGMPGENGTFGGTAETLDAEVRRVVR